MARRERSQNIPEDYDIGYGLSTVALTVGKTIVSTTQASYHGISIIAGGTTGATVDIFDSLSASTGNIIDLFIVTSGRNTWIDRYIPVKAKIGLVVSLTGTGARGAIFYGPKG